MPRDPSGRKGYSREGNPVFVSKSVSPRVNIEESGDDLFGIYRREYDDWDEQTYDDRDDAIVARDYYDGIQWTADEVDELNERRQPILTKNLIAPKINFVLGSETENRVDPKAYPRTLYHEMDAEVVTDGLKYIVEQDDFDYTKSSVANNKFVEGTGGAVFSVECCCSEDAKDSEEHYERCPDPNIHLEHINWDRLYWDPRSRKFNFRDAKYLGVIVWMHKEDALDEFITEDMSDEERDRITGVIESAYDGDYSTGDAAQDAPRKWQDSSDRVQFFETYRYTDGEWSVAYWTWSGWIHEPRVVDFVDEKGKTWCPLLISSCFVTRNNVRYGLIKNMISPQDEVNKRASRALHLLHTTGVISEQDSILDPDTFQAELARPDGNATVLPGRLRDGSVQLRENTQLASAQLAMADKAEAAINQIGPHAALVASDQRVQSGRMFMARQQAGSMEIKPAFDHLNDWTLRAFRGYWNLIRQFWTSSKWFRVRDDISNQGNRFVALNREMTRGERVKELVEDGMELKEAVSHVMQEKGIRLLEAITVQVEQMKQQQQAQMQQMQQQGPGQGQELPEGPPEPPPSVMEILMQTEMSREEYTDNDVAQLDVDIVLDTVPSSPAVRQEQYAELVTLAQTTLPVMSDEQVRNKLLALIFHHSDLRQEAKRQFVDLLTPKPPSQAEQQQSAMMQQMQQQQMQLAIAQLQATVQKLQADAMKSQAQAQKVSAETQIAIPAAAQLDQAQASKAAADAQLNPDKADLLQAQVYKTESEAEVIESGEEQQMVSEDTGTGGN